MGNMSAGLSDKLWWSGLDRHDHSWMLRNQMYDPRVYSWGWNNQRGSPRDNPKGSS